MPRLLGTKRICVAGLAAVLTLAGVSSGQESTDDYAIESYVEASATNDVQYSENDLTSYESSVPCYDCCSACGMQPCCCPPMRQARFRVFGEFLYLQARDADIAFGIPQDGLIVGAVPVGAVGSAKSEYEPGYRIGAAVDLGYNSSLTATWSSYESSTSDQIGIPVPNVINPLIMYPGTLNAGARAQEAFATHEIDFQRGSIEYQAAWTCSKQFQWGWLAGVEYAKLEQDLQARFPFATPDGETRVASNVQYDGIGPRLGIKAARRVHPCAGISVYGRGAMTLLAGEYRARYEQANQFNGVEATTAHSEDKIVPVLDLELGLSWINHDGWLQITAGYVVSSWFNAVTTSEWIDGVQVNDFDLSDRITFDGAVLGCNVYF